MAPSQKAMASREWSLATCHMLQDLATKVTDRMYEDRGRLRHVRPVRDASATRPRRLP